MIVPRTISTKRTQHARNPDEELGPISPRTNTAFSTTSLCSRKPGRAVFYIQPKKTNVTCARCLKLLGFVL